MNKSNEAPDTPNNTETTKTPFNTPDNVNEQEFLGAPKNLVKFLIPENLVDKSYTTKKKPVATFLTPKNKSIHKLPNSK